ncbi:MAG: porin [Polaromonas sp.]|uniref:porin n=1 Tax=Polaromonas sp. TaxID=1869339 RepID=UPI0018069471|nr:porin [Polaromonas sp.]NMM11759.1 porin [Polaromonas sp.]
MKKLTLVATAVMGLLSTTAAMAQSTVTIYGLIDGGVNYVSGLKNGSSTSIASGIMEGSRFGLRGTEDIGGGYKAIFTLENRFEVDTGSVSNRPASGDQLPDRMSSAAGLGLTGAAALAAPVAIPLINATIANGFGVNVGATGGRLFDRQAFAGLVTPIGAFTLGRQYTPGYLVGATFDATQTQSSLAVGQLATFPPAFDIRLSNTLQYAIQTGGFTAALMYGAGEVAGNNSASRFFGGMVIYKGNGFSVGYGRNQRKNELGQNSLENNVLGASVDVGPGTLYGQYTTIKDENPTGLSGIGAAITAKTGSAALGAAYQAAYTNAFIQDASLAQIGYRLTSGVNTVVVAYNRLNDKRPNNASADSYGATYTYALSKRTNLNAVLTRFNNKGTSQAAPGGNGFLGGVTSAAGVGSTNVAFGIRHTF